MNHVRLAAGVAIFLSLTSIAVAGSFNDVTSATFTLQGTATNYITGQVRTGLLGQGSFSYTADNWEQTYEFPFTSPVLTIQNSDNYRLLSNFHASLFGKEFGPSYFGGGGSTFASSVDYLWKLPLDAGETFPDGQMEPGIVLHESGGGPQGHYELRNQWSFGTSSVIVDLLTLESNGTWWYVNSGGPGEPLTADGTWTASPAPVPEPMTIAATVLAAGLGLLLRRTCQVA